MKESFHLVLLASAVLLALMSVAGQGETGQSHFEVSGTTPGNSGCAILEKHTPVKGKLLALGVVYARTEYEVIDSFNYKMPKAKFTGRGEIEDLNRLAAKDKVKLVVIPSNYTPEQLDGAQKLCREPAGSKSPDPPSEKHP